MAKDAFTAGLFKGDDAMATDKAITREQAMLMAFNAFFYGKEVTKNTTLYLVSAGSGSAATNVPTSIIGNTYTTTAAAIADAVKANASAVLGRDYTLTPISGTVTTVENSLAKTVYGVTTAKSTDASGRTTTQYLDKDGKVISTTAATSTLSYTTPVKSNDLYNALGLTTGTTGTTAAVKTNGTADSTFVIARNSSAVIGGNGVLTEVYRSGANVSIVVTQPTFGKVTNITTGKEANGSVYSLYEIGTGVSFGTKASYKLYTSALNNEESAIVLKGNVAKGDYITVSVIGGVATVTPATLVTGKLTGYASATGVYTIEGKGYQLSGAAGAAAPSTYNSTSTFAVDSYGYLLGAVTVTIPTNYVYLMEDEESYVLNGTTLVKSIVGTILTTDGKVEKVALDKTATGTAAGLYSYTVNTKGAYVLTPVSADVNTSLAPNSPAIASGKYANAATKFIVANWTKDESGTPVFAGTVNVVTGYANLSALTGVDGSYIDANNDGIAEVVFIEKSSVAATATNYVYFLGTKSTTDGSTWVYDVVVKGAVGTVTGTTGFTGAGMYSIDVSNAATATTFSTAFVALGTDATYTNVTVENKGGLLYVADTYVAVVANNVPVYTITAATGTAAAGTAADLTNAVTGNVIICSSSTAITAIYVIA